MPEVRLTVRWPDESMMNVYSPSTAIKEHLEAGVSYELDDFLARARRGLEAASERVRLKYGHACSRARDQLGEIEFKAGRYAALSAARVKVEAVVEVAGG